MHHTLSLACSMVVEVEVVVGDGWYGLKLKKPRGSANELSLRTHSMIINFEFLLLLISSIKVG